MVDGQLTSSHAYFILLVGRAALSTQFHRDKCEGMKWQMQGRY